MHICEICEMQEAVSFDFDWLIDDDIIFPLRLTNKRSSVAYRSAILRTFRRCTNKLE